MSRATAFYDAADWYDFLHAPETEAELPAVLSIFGALGNGGKRVLEPACGTGRYLAALQERGFDCLGYDVNKRALAFARRRGCRVVKTDMARYRSAERFDLALCLIGSFRHLLTEATALAHLRNTAEALAPGGLYIIGMDLCDYGRQADDEEVWEHRERARAAWHVMTTFAPTRRRRLERILNFIAWRDGAKEGRLESDYLLRSYDWRQWSSLLRKAGLRLVGWFDQEGERRRSKRSGYWLFALAAAQSDAP